MLHFTLIFLNIYSLFYPLSFLSTLFFKPFNSLFYFTIFSTYKSTRTAVILVRVIVAVHVSVTPLVTGDTELVTAPPLRVQTPRVVHTPVEHPDSEASSSGTGGEGGVT